MSLIAIDPGSERSAWVEYNPRPGGLLGFGYDDNPVVKGMLARWVSCMDDHLAVEMIASYGMPVGREVFETCVWIGRYLEAWGRPHTLVYRGDVKLHLCGSKRAKDGNVRQALIDRFGPTKQVAIGTKKQPGPLYGVSGDVWSALAVAVTWMDSRRATAEFAAPLGP